MAPAPYHAMYGAGDVPPVNRDESEKVDPHPVYRAFMHHRESEAFVRDEVRATVIPTYMGLITQIDDHLGRLLSFLETCGVAERTVVVVTSDHGDYLGDHWLGEKQILHEPSVRIPLIVHDPDPTADATRGRREERFTESIDLVPTFIDLAGGDDRPHRLQGRSLRPLLEGRADVTWRDAAFAEVDYAWRQARQELGLEPHEARGYMVRTERWKYVYFERFPPQLFDLATDPDERQDLGRDPGHVAVRDELNTRLFDWFRNQFNRITVRNSQVEAATNKELKKGIRYGIW
jgi:arylsulfatase A-like enzyme